MNRCVHLSLKSRAGMVVEGLLIFAVCRLLEVQAAVGAATMHQITQYERKGGLQ